MASIYLFFVRASAYISTPFINFKNRVLRSQSQFSKPSNIPITSTASSTSRKNNDKKTKKRNSNKNCDAYDDIQIDIALKEVEIAMNLFFDNKFEESKAMLKLHTDHSIYHAITFCIITFIEALLSYDPTKITEVSTELRNCLKLCDQYKKSRDQKSIDFDHYSEIKIHSEIVTAEALLIYSLLSFIENRMLIGLLKGSIKMTNCYSTFHSCEIILNDRNTWLTYYSKTQFESGICLGMGIFNLMISLLPSNVVKLLEIIGYDGSKEKGLDYLENGYKLPGYHRALCALEILAYNLIAVFNLSHTFGDLEQCDEILEKEIEVHPNSIWFLYFQGRSELMKGNLNIALEWYLKIINAQEIFNQFNTICFGDIYLIHCFKLEWIEASVYADFVLEQGNRWSQTTYYYEKAIALYMLPSIELDQVDYRIIDELMLKTSSHKGAISPMEKFFIKRSQRYFIQKKNLVLPGIELIYIKNMFKIFGKNTDIALNILEIIENQLTVLENLEDIIQDEPIPFYTIHEDNKALVLLLKGACLRFLLEYEEAIECLNDVVELKDLLKEDHFLVPHAISEIGFIYKDQGKIEKAISTLEDVKKNYSRYLLEQPLIYRIDCCLNEIKLQPTIEKKTKQKNNSKSEILLKEIENQ